MRRFPSAVLLLAGLVSSTAWALPPAKDFVRSPQFERVSISPTGKYLAAVIAPKGNPVQNALVFFKTRALLNHHDNTLYSFRLTNGTGIGSLNWVGNKRVAFSTLGNVGGFDEPYRTGDLYAVNVNGGQFKQLMPWPGFWFDYTISTLPDRQNYLLVDAVTHAYPQAYLIDTMGTNISDAHGSNSYRFKKAQSPGSFGLWADNDGNIRFSMGADPKTGQLEYYYRPKHSEHWKNYTAVMPTPIKNRGPSHPGFAGFTPDNKQIYLLKYAANKNETKGLFVFDPKTQKSRLLYADATVDAGGSDFSSYGALIYSFDDKKIVGLRIMPGKIDTLVLDPKSPKIQDIAALTQTFPHQQVEIVSSTRDGSDSVVRVWSDTNPGAYYLLSHKPKPMLTLLFKADPWVKHGELSPMTPITFKARDGLVLHGYLTLPKGSKGKDLPMLVIVHGGPYGIRDHWGYDPEVQLFASRGYAVLQVNYRGSGGYGNKFLTLGVRHWGDTMQDDVADGVQWAIKQGYADPNRVCIYGVSYGGYSALMSAELFPALYKCAIGYSGVYDLPLLKRRSSDVARTVSGRLFLNEVLGSSAAQLKKFSPVDQVASLKAPVLLMHGGEDQRAPVKGYKEMVAAIKQHGTPLETLYFSNEGHGFYKFSDRLQAYKKILAFLQQYIGTKQQIAQTSH